MSGCMFLGAGGVGRFMHGRAMLSNAGRPGMPAMVAVVKEVHGRICRMSHQKCLTLVSRMCIFSCRTREGAGLAEVR